MSSGPNVSPLAAAHSRLRVCAKSVFLCRQLPALPLRAFFISCSRVFAVIESSRTNKPAAPAFAIPLRTSESWRPSVAG